MRIEKPYVLCVDVGGPKNIGWADAEGRSGSGTDLQEGLSLLSDQIIAGRAAALGFEAPIWTPRRTELARITGRRGGLETTHNRPWCAGAGGGALGAALALMPWCLSEIASRAGSVSTTVDVARFHALGGLLLWEAFVSATMKVVGSTHHDDARLACDAFTSRWPDLTSDVPAEPAFNHAVSSAIVTGLSVDCSELTLPAIVIGVTAKLGHSG